MWQAGRHFHLSDFVNGEHWQDGWTGTIAHHGRRVWSPSPADLCLYGSGPDYEHVSIYTGGGLCVSHGSWRGPLLLPVHYRSDFAQYRRML